MARDEDPAEAGAGSRPDAAGADDAPASAPATGSAHSAEDGAGPAGEADASGSTELADESRESSSADGDPESTGTDGDGRAPTGAAAEGAGAAERPDEESPERPLRWWTHRLPRRSAALIGVLVALLGFALAVRVNSNDSDQALAGARQEDLVRILDTLDSRKERLQQEISSLNSQRQQISSSEQGREEALKDARERADDMGILAGTLPAEGPGLSVVFAGGRDGVGASVLLDAVEELRGAGAEAMQIRGASGGAVRIVAPTSFVGASGGSVLVDSHRLSGRLTLSVIGDPSTMQAALNIPGGVVDTVRQAGGSVRIRQPGTVQVSTTRPMVTHRYARPVS